MNLTIASGLITIASTNFDKLVGFYTDILGGQPQRYIPNVYAEYHIPGVQLGIFQPKPAHENEFSNAAQSKISLCLEVNDLESAIQQLTALGYPPPGAITTASHGREVYAYDPDGNRIILHSWFIQNGTDSKL